MIMRRKRKGLKIILIILLLLALSAALLYKFLFVIRNAEVIGAQSYTPDSIVRSAQIDFGKSIFRIDENEIAHNINAAGRIAYDAAEIRYPDTLILYVHERQAAAMAAHAGLVLILDENGVVINTEAQIPNSDLMYISNFDISAYGIGETVNANPQQLEAYCAVAQAVQANNARAYVSELDLSDTNNIVIITRTGIRVQLGNASNMDSKIAWMKSAVSDLEARGSNSGTLDVASGTKADFMPYDAAGNE